MNSLTFRLVLLTVTMIPGVALAQGGSVTTSPLAQPVPAMSASLLLALSLVLAGIAWRMLRSAPKGSLAALVLAAVTAAGAGIVNATPSNIIIDGDECNERYTHEYNSNYGPRDLVNNCTNAIEVVTVAPGCGGTEDLGNVSEIPSPMTPTPECINGTVLANSQSCRLPDCRI